jgi:hypothetical protein
VDEVIAASYRSSYVELRCIAAQYFPNLVTAQEFSQSLRQMIDFVHCGVEYHASFTKQSLSSTLERSQAATRGALKRSPAWLRSRKEVILRMRRGTPRRSEKNCLLTKRSANLANAYVSQFTMGIELRVVR